MALSDEDVARVREATDLAALVGERVGLRPQGARLVGLCPFHSERTPSFSVNPTAGFYHCFGCGASGDAITFVRQTEHLDFVEAVEWLAARAGVALERRRAPDRARARRERAGEALGRAVSWYHTRLLEAPDARAAREYLRSRGISGSLARRFQLGWAPAGPDELCRALELPADLAKETGLGRVSGSGRLQDAFRSRILFPIFDVAGRPVAFGGRVLPGNEAVGPKYLNSPESDLYAKRRLLYGLNWAKEAVVRAGEVVVCEGYTDVIGLVSAGVERAVATCGTALSDEHLALLARFARRVVLAFDADAAGTRAAERIYGWEARHDLEVAVVRLPEGEDPGALAAREPSLLVEAVAAAQPFLAFRLSRLLAEAEFASPDRRARLARDALTLVAEHPDELVRDHYVMEVATRCRQDDRALRRLLGTMLPGARAGTSGGRQDGPGRVAPQGRTGPSASPGATGPSGSHGRRGPTAPLGGVDAAGRRGGNREEGAAAVPATALEALRLAVRDPATTLGELRAPLFPPGPAREAFLLLEAAGSTHGAVDAAERAGETELAALLRRLAVDADEPAEDAVARLVLDATRRALDSADREARARPDQAGALLVIVRWLKETAALLQEDPARRDAEAALVAWLCEPQGVPGETANGGLLGEGAGVGGDVAGPTGAEA